MSILGIHAGALGDVILFGQLLSALKAHGGGPVRLVAGGEKADLLAGLGAVDAAADFDSLPMEEAFSSKPAGECSLAGRLGPPGPNCGAGAGWGLLVSCFGAGSEPAEKRLAAMASARRAIFLPARPPQDFAGHLVDYWAGLTGLDVVPSPHWTVPASWKTLAEGALASAGVKPGTPYLLIHPGAGSVRKCWPLERFVELARQGCFSSLSLNRKSKIANRKYLLPVFVLGPAELGRWGVQTLAALRAEFPVITCPALEVLAGLAAVARAYLGNDSGPTHLAAALGTPTLAMFGPSNPVHFAPRGRKVAVLGGGDLAGVTADSVISALEKV